jgi:hypothetical protein
MSGIRVLNGGKRRRAVLPLVLKGEPADSASKKNDGEHLELVDSAPRENDGKLLELADSASRKNDCWSS